MSPSFLFSISLVVPSYSRQASSRLLSNFRFSFSSFNFSGRLGQAGLASLFPLFRHSVPSRSVAESCAYPPPFIEFVQFNFKVVGIFRTYLRKNFISLSGKITFQVKISTSLFSNQPSFKTLLRTFSGSVEYAIIAKLFSVRLHVT